MNTEKPLTVGMCINTIESSKRSIKIYKTKLKKTTDLDKITHYKCMIIENEANIYYFSSLVENTLFESLEQLKEQENKTKVI